MENQILINAINEAIQKAVPSIVDEVTQKLNNTKSSRKERWENLTLDDIKKLAASSDYRDRCRAASHPKATSDILNFLEGDSDKKVRNTVHQVKKRNLFNSLSCLEDYINLCQNVSIQSMRKLARKLLKEDLFAGKFDSEIRSLPSSHMFSFCYPLENLINLTTDQTFHLHYNTYYFAKLMLEYRFNHLIKGLLVEEVQLLDYAIKNRISITQPGSNNQTVHP